MILNYDLSLRNRHENTKLGRKNGGNAIARPCGAILNCVYALIILLFV